MGLIFFYSILFMSDMSLAFFWSKFKSTLKYIHYTKYLVLPHTKFYSKQILSDAYFYHILVASCHNCLTRHFAKHTNLLVVDSDSCI